MREQLLPAVKMLALLTLLLGLLYPLTITGLTQALFPRESNGSLVPRDGQIIGSDLQAQAFTSDRYFHPRPSTGYDGASTGGSNLGPTNPELLTAVAARIADYRDRNHLDEDTPIPVDAVTTSGSGLDPHISIANAQLQVARVAAARGLPDGDVLELVERTTDRRALGFLGEPTVNVLRLNLALDESG
jgi:potassium-transporting ATPase KdpC subunit